MKKLAAIVLAASAVMAMTGCTPQLSTSETCVELRAIVSGVPSSPSEDEQKEVAAALDKLSGRASDTLKEVIRDVAFMTGERLKPTEEQDTAKMDEAQARVEAKNDMMKSTCNL